ncbi:MAG: sulfotransferase family protein [Beijerinckiaceae bacterium]
MGGFAFHLIGAGRGGTSLLGGLIDSHPDCEVCFEQLSTDFLMGRVPTDAETAENSTIRASKRIRNFMEACETLAAKVPDKLWGHKTTTEHIGALGSPAALDSTKNTERPVTACCLNLFVSSLSRVPTIFIVRDGRTCVRSKVNRTGQPLNTAIERWKFSIRVLSTLRANHERLLVIKFEDLVVSPRQVLPQVCDFLNVAYKEEMLRGTNSPKMMLEYRSDGFDHSKLEFEDNGEQWVADLRGELELAGYPAE